MVTIKVRVEMRDDTPLGIPSGKTKWHVLVLDSGGHPFAGCPLGRSTRGEREAITDLIRPCYSLPADTTVTLADVEVTERRDYRTAVTSATAAERSALNALANTTGPQHEAMAHRFLCHSDGGECPDGCNTPANPRRLTMYRNHLSEGSK
jgi:hypothetical protein